MSRPRKEPNAFWDDPVVCWFCDLLTRPPPDDGTDGEPGEEDEYVVVNRPPPRQEQLTTHDPRDSIHRPSDRAQFQPFSDAMVIRAPNAQAPPAMNKRPGNNNKTPKPKAVVPWPTALERAQKHFKASGRDHRNFKKGTELHKLARDIRDGRVRL